MGGNRREGMGDKHYKSQKGGREGERRKERREGGREGERRELFQEVDTITS